MFNSNRSEDEGTKTMDSTETDLNKRDNDDDIFFEERVLRNLYAAINHHEKCNCGKARR